MSTISSAGRFDAAAVSHADSISAPWYVWCAALAVTSSTVGAHWDISWHRTIGRDTFLTPAHIAIYMCGVLAAISCGYTILSSTWNRGHNLHGGTVRIWGFYGPFGAFIASWGGVAMLTSAPFDNWWHNAYGLDVKIVSPPHVLLFAGAIAVTLGGLILTLGYMNRAAGRSRATLEWLFLYLGAQTIIIFQTLLLEFTGRTLLHSSLPYRVMALFLPFVLVAVARASSHRFAATWVAGFYCFYIIAEILILPLFPAQPKLGPVYQPVTHFIPQGFPILLFVPALALDLLRQRTRNWNAWLISAVGAVLFVGLLLAVEWPFADFLQSPASRNAFFGSAYLAYQTPPASHIATYTFAQLDTGWAFLMNMIWATVFALFSIRVGLAWGTWMRAVRR
jgi:hypothetical protein